ncbi:manganese efflux pump MntP family protein [Ruminococcaceae bacterium OttesenSCG-928-N02]|nr:manganese efflux pump MntP family protein [Ruminococcaceae bacterium OttesenSCG-928-N02]
MGFLEISLISIGLAMDAFAVAVGKGLTMQEVRKKHAAIIALFFGAFQAAMPLIGWLLGHQFESYITSVDHWIAFCLLLVIGGKMVKEGFSHNEEEELATGHMPFRLNFQELTLLAIATSIDALAVGVTFAFLQVKILWAVGIIGVSTFAICYLGVYIGNWFGAKYKGKAEVFGGAVLILMGLKILLEHTL